MDFAKKLEEYRRNKSSYLKEKSTVIMNTEDKAVTEKLLHETSTINSESSDDQEDYLEDDSLKRLTLLDFLYYGLCFVLWVILYAIFIKLQFGTIFFIVSCLLGIYINTRTSPKRKGEVSAYSVFNKDCKSIDGTLKAEQFEREIRYGPSSMQ